MTDSPARNRVLVIDDDEMVRQVFQRFLQAAGFDVLIASNGAAGLKIMGDDPSIGLVLLDLDMPGMDGRHVRNIQLADPQLAAIPTIIVTGSAAESIQPEGMETDLLRKPVSRDFLIEVVSRYCWPTSP